MKNFLTKISCCVLIVLSVSFYSCSENPVVNPPPKDEIEIIDSNFFDWEIYEDNNDNYGWKFFVSDTHTIYFDGISSLIKYNKGVKTSYKYNITSFKSAAVYGNIKNEIYVSGINQLSSTSYIPALKKFDGSSFIDIPININRQSTITQVTFGIENDLWLPTDAYSVYRFHNGKTTEYRFDTTYNNSSLEIIENIPQLIKNKTGILGNNFNKYYKFINNEWNEYSINEQTEPEGLSDYCGFIDGEFYSNSNSNFIYKLSGLNWMPIINTKYNFYCYNLIIDKNENFMLCGAYEYDYGRIIYLTNNKIYRQTNFRNPKHPNVGGINIIYKFNKYYILHDQREIFKSSFAIGTLKQ